MKTSDQPVIVEQLLNASVNKVWKAVTDRDLMVKWFFDNIPSFKPETGFKTQFNVVSGERNFLHLWEVTKVIPEKKITCNWRYEGYEGLAEVTFELFEKGNSTNFKVTAEVKEDFTDGIPEFERESCVGGWEYFIQGSLKNFFE